MLLGLSVPALSQNYKCATHTFQDSIYLQGPVEPGSLSISPDLPHTFSHDDNLLVINIKSATDSIKVCYRTISHEIYRSFYNRDIRSYAKGSGSSGLRHAARADGLQLEQEELFQFGNIESYGAITRGVTFGNRQNLFVNSSLNLQMDGDLSDDLKVSAVITDQNIPYQPEGNTQQIRDFDNVFIKLYNNDFEVVAGDLVIQNPVEDSYFLKYYKNVQGLSLKYRYQLSEKWHGKSLVTGSLAKGQFTSAVIEPIDGVQGPYKLRGPNGERFIVVLANSERVYLEGKLLERGFDRDYVIDYNLGEITFMSGTVITRFSRIRVDYEYADQYYTRSNISAVQELSSDRTRVYFNFYREKDNPTNTLGFDLDDQDLMNLRAAGDQKGLATISGVDSVGYMDNGVLYRKRDTLISSGQRVEIYEYSTDPDQGIFRLSFSEVGNGKGSYILTNSSANGKIYQWVSPVDGQLQGNYAPVRVLPTPNKKQMLVMGASHQISDHEVFFQETAISGLDQNLYSNVDDEDNHAVAWKGGFASKGRRIGKSGAYKLKAKLTYEFDQAGFSGIDRFRSIDYDRDWSYNSTGDSINRQDQIMTTSVSVMKDKNNSLLYDFNWRKRSGMIHGTQHELNVNHEVGPFFISSRNFYLKNQPGPFTSQWLRSSQMVRFNKWRVQPGYQFTIDKNTTQLAGADSISNSLMHYTAHDFFVETADSSRSHVRLDYIVRKDHLPVNGEMQPYTDANEIRLGTNFLFLPNQKIGAHINYREVKEQIGERKTDENLLGKVNWHGSFWNNLVRNSLTYTTANSRELRREYIFVNVPTGEGTHTWRDENDDGIQDINEFYEAINADEKNYIKLFTPTDEYINAFQTTYLQTLDAKLPAQWKQKGGVLAFMSRLSFNTNLKYNIKTSNPSFGSRINIFYSDLGDSVVLSARNLVRHTIFYNRNAPGFGFDVTQTRQNSKSLLSNGYEVNAKEDWLGTARLGFSSLFTLRTKAGFGTTISSSDFLLSRNFNLNRRILATELVWQPISTFRLITGYERRIKNTYESEHTGASGINEFRVETTWVRSTKGNLNASFNWLMIDFEGVPNTYLAYELLEALQPGANQRWRVNWQQSVGKGLQLSVQYSGRKSTESAPVHTGTMQVTAFF